MRASSRGRRRQERPGRWEGCEEFGVGKGGGVVSRSEERIAIQHFSTTSRPTSLSLTLYVHTLFMSVTLLRPSQDAVSMSGCSHAPISCPHNSKALYACGIAFFNLASSLM